MKKRLNLDRLVSLDLFSGSGIVSRYLKRHSSCLIVNDLEEYSRVINQCYLSNDKQVNHTDLQMIHSDFESQVHQHWHPGFITDLYAPKDEADITKDDRVFYTRRNAIYLDTARSLIAKCPIEIQHFLLAPLLYEASVHNNTSGVFKGFYKNRSGVGTYGGEGRNALVRICGDMKLRYPIFSNFDSDVQVFQSDANCLVKQLPELDFAYLDPPYNQHPYGSNYFMLNLLARNQRPGTISPVSGIPQSWNRSSYNKRQEAQGALFDLVDHCPAKFIMISYNSEGFVSYEAFQAFLASLGHVQILETNYNTFRGGRNLSDRMLKVKEFLFLLEKK